MLVVKLGGGGVRFDHVCRDVRDLTATGHRVTLVHGGGDDIDSIGERLGVSQVHLRGDDGRSSRYTDAATLEVMLLAVLGRVKPRILRELHRNRVPALGLSGLDLGVLRGRRHAPHRGTLQGRRVVIRDDYCGLVSFVNGQRILALLDEGIVPVVSPPALDEDGQPVNVDADRVAAAIARAVTATHLVFLTDTPGVLAAPPDEASALKEYVVADLTRGSAIEGMATKVAAARDALRGGVAFVCIADGRCDEPLKSALAGAGTRLLLEEAARHA